MFAAGFCLAQCWGLQAWERHRHCPQVLHLVGGGRCEWSVQIGGVSKGKLGPKEKSRIQQSASEKPEVDRTWSISLEGICDEKALQTGLQEAAVFKVSKVSLSKSPIFFTALGRLRSCHISCQYLGHLVDVVWTAPVQIPSTPARASLEPLSMHCFLVVCSPPLL